ncbi:hypothetical protein MWN33_07770 [Starkeya koreensis]|uniref:Flagellar FliJ protein n=1 Tax=Ancylobacter koreensis TaxID=266121 RepID=A0ABT0DKW5_9HYPH|nr:hypothetical protein [Ancylobacter koreensis]MCK0207930.1 hypothetical protein [Ancylobacter koreensis]
MREALRKCRRIEAVQDQLHRRAEAEAARLERALADVDAERRAVLAAMSHEDFAPLMIAAAARRLRGLDAEMARLRAELEAQRARVREAAIRLKLAEGLSEKAGVQARAHDERRALDEALEAAVARSHASFPPA